jgi:D-alanyl-D-alanine dipeptidase
MIMIKKYTKALMLCLLLGQRMCQALPEEARAKGFVYLHEVDPTIKISPRYYGTENFVGATVDGYEKSVIILTRQAAEALKKVQEAVKRDGYSLVVYDGYRPQRAVNYFLRWSKAVHDQQKKFQYYPRINKAYVRELGYVATKRSGHSRGSTVDLTIIDDKKALHAPQEKSRTLLDGFTIIVLDDGTVDMGSSFDLFDVASHTENDLIADHYKVPRAYLKAIMEKHGFKNYASEWWHFTLVNEPFPTDQDSSYFDFPVN